VDLGAGVVHRRPRVQRVELPIGDATMALSLAEIREAIATLAG
jgi:hypothetical protein